MTSNVEPVRGLNQWDVSMVFTLLFVAIMLAVTRAGMEPAVAVYALSFWHYYLYWLAYRYGAVSLGNFKRDAIVMKTVALLALAYAYGSVPPDFLSLAVVAAGFLLNIAAARALGSDRTYYGREVAGLPPQRITAFPYSWIAHPMLAGNIAAFGGTLINADFREHWWPLAGIHVALNIGLLVMEFAVKPLRRNAAPAPAGEARPDDRGQLLLAGCSVVAAGAGMGGALGLAGPWSPDMFLAAGMGACVSGYACMLLYCYARPGFVHGGRQVIQLERTA